MKKNSTRRFSIKEIYWITVKAFCSTKYLVMNRKNNYINHQFVERIMLAVTQVNECEACSFAHAKMAIDAGLSESEINNLLSGMNDDVPQEQLKAVLFAQHYAENVGKASLQTWQKIVIEYGNNAALSILASIRMIMMGNAYGIPFSLLINRFKKDRNKDERSNLFYEISTILISILIIPVSAIHAFINCLSGYKYVDFK